jgi:hypothetical protein
MKLFYKITCAAAAVCIGLGLILGGMGLLMGGTIRGLFQAGETGSHFHWRKPSWWGEETVRKSYEGIQKLDFDLGCADITIRAGDSFSLEAEGVNSSKFQSRQDGDTWKIQCSDWSQGGFSLLRKWKGEAPRIAITVPQGFVARELELGVGMGTLDAQGLEAQESEITVGMGEMVLSDFRSGDCEMDVGMGTLELTGEIRGKSSIHCGMGSARLTLDGEPDDYDYTASAGIGSVEVDGQRAGGLGGDITRDTGASNRFQIDCGMGEVVLRFQ